MTEDTHAPPSDGLPMRLLSDYQVVRASAPSTFACLGDRAKVLLQGNLILPEGRQPTNRKGESLIMQTASTS